MRSLVSLLRRSIRPLVVRLARRDIFLDKNDRRLLALKDRHKGEDAVIIGMGPSLKPEDLDRFKDKITFGCNKIYLAYDQVEMRPDYYSVIDVVVAENNAKEIGAVKGSAKIFPHYLRRYLPAMPDATFVHAIGHLRDHTDRPLFRKDPLEGLVGGGATVVFTQLQLAYWMGCKTVYVVGLDFSFKVPEPVGGLSNLGEQILKNGEEVNHFHKDYRKPGETWTMPKMDDQREAFAYARKVFEKDGRKLLNASRETKLEELERVDFETVFPALK